MYKKKIIIAGPCSAETFEQLDSIVNTFVANETLPDFLRAGVWKPRSRPGNFEGNGEKALQWLQEIKTKYKIDPIIEVAGTEQVELALKYEINNFWIGARTSANPFQVQEIADSISGINSTIFVKNSIHTDLPLWIGNVERIAQKNKGVTGAIHRGFATYSGHEKYRNVPNWAIPLDFKRLMPDTPLLCDPSHISGHRDLVFEVGQKAWNMNFDGLMIEVHNTPEEAWSDAIQQITPPQFKEFLDNWTITDFNSVSEDKLIIIENMRSLIDSLDYEIIDLIGKRMEISIDMADLKKEMNIPAYIPERWDEILKSRNKYGKKYMINDQFIQDLFSIIHQQSIQNQLTKMDNKVK